MALTRWVVASTFSLLLIGALVAFNSSERTLPSLGSSFDVQDPTSELASSGAGEDVQDPTSELDVQDPTSELVSYAYGSSAASLNVVRENAGRTGGWGGSCTCPDGSTYWVGDRNNNCGSLACYGGTAGTCHEYVDDKWKGRDVTCGGTCMATHTQMWGGYDVQFTRYTGYTTAEKDASCCANCNANYRCEFWVRSTDDTSCWLKAGKNWEDWGDSNRRGGMRLHATASPTANPTASVAPSDTPTAAPTKTPTAAPTKTPTAAPTKTPTAAASDTPAAAPSDTPAAAPSAEHMRRRRRKVEQEEEDN